MGAQADLGRINVVFSSCDGQKYVNYIPMDR